MTVKQLASILLSMTVTETMEAMGYPLREHDESFGEGKKIYVYKDKNRDFNCFYFVNLADHEIKNYVNKFLSQLEDKQTFIRNQIRMIQSKNVSKVAEKIGNAFDQLKLTKEQKIKVINLLSERFNGSKEE